jgi:hypothetical protein
MVDAGALMHLVTIERYSPIVRNTANDTFPCTYSVDILELNQNRKSYYT